MSREGHFTLRRQVYFQAPSIPFRINSRRLESPTNMQIKRERHPEHNAVPFRYCKQPQSLMTHLVINGTDNC